MEHKKLFNLRSFVVMVTIAIVAPAGLQIFVLMGLVIGKGVFRIFLSDETPTDLRSYMYGRYMFMYVAKTSKHWIK